VNPSSGGNEISVNRSWDGIWNARVRRSEIGWTIEIEIPFRTLNFDPNASAWGINFERIVRRKNEEDVWVGYARNQSLTRMSNAGHLEGLSEISQGVGLDVNPYVVSSLRQLPGRGDGRTRQNTNAGMDIFYNLTPSLRANFTVNTDFAETEVDQRLVNLTRFPLRFDEQRDFFLEGASFFDFAQGRLEPFFSRRIGLTEGQIQPIRFGVKVTGQVNANDIGFLQMQTSDEDTRFGQRRQFISEDFTVLRARRQVFTQSYVGMIYTRRAERGTGTPDLHTGGVDFAFNSSRFRGDQNLNLWGFWAWNNTPNQPTGRLGGHALGLRLDYPNEIWVSRVSYRVWGENHDPAIGFTPRRNVQRMSPQLNYLPRLVNHRWIRRFSFGWDGEWVAGLDNTLQTMLQNYNVFGIDLHSGDSFDFFIAPNFERLIEDFEIHPGIVLPEGTESQRLAASVRSRSGPPTSGAHSFRAIVANLSQP
jgi:hypothetical protein